MNPLFTASPTAREAQPSPDRLRELMTMARVLRELGDYEQRMVSGLRLMSWTAVLVASGIALFFRPWWWVVALAVVVRVVLEIGVRIVFGRFHDAAFAEFRKRFPKDEGASS